MPYTWFRHESTAGDHPKMSRLRLELEDPLADAYVSRLWSWTQRFAPSGFIPTELLDVVEAQIGDPAPPVCARWARSKVDPDLRGVPIQFRSTLDPTSIRGRLGAMVKVGWLDPVEDGLEVHDWEEMQGKLVEKSKRDASAKRLKRKLAARERREPGARRIGADLAPKRDETRRDETDLMKADPGPAIVDPPDPATARFIEFLDWKAATRRDRGLPVDCSPPRRAPNDDWWAELDKHAWSYGWSAERVTKLYLAYLDDTSYRLNELPAAKLDPPYPITAFARDWIYFDTLVAMPPARGAR